MFRSLIKYKNVLLKQVLIKFLGKNMVFVGTH
jgi:hypothetical protein